MQELFVLGAGFSRAFVSTAPLANGFFANYKESFSDDLTEFLTKQHLGDVGKLDVEKLLTLASLEPSWLDGRERARLSIIREDIMLCISKVIDTCFVKIDPTVRDFSPRKHVGDDISPFCFNVNEHGTQLENFAVYLIKHSGSVDIISHNWDILLENALEYEQFRVSSKILQALDVPDQGSPYFHVGRSYGFQAIEVDRHGKTYYSERGAQSTDIHVLKLHGSINWRCRRAPGVPINPNDVLALRCHDDILESLPAKYAVDCEFEQYPFIVPPALDKSTFLQQPVLNVIWNRAADRIKNAEKIVFIGYSFPVTDFYSEFLFRHHTPSDCEVVAVDCRTDDSAKKELRNRYESIFGRPVEHHFDGAVDYIKNILNNSE